MYTPDNKQLISCADDKTIRMWDTASGSETRKYGIPFQPLFYFLTSFLAVAPEPIVVDPPLIWLSRIRIKEHGN